MQNSLAEKYPDLTLEWSDKNYPLTPHDVSFGSNRSVWWRGSCGHEWKASVKNRTLNSTGCPYCSHNLVLKGFNDLATLFPGVAVQWSKKNDLKPTEVTAFSNKKVWWKCSEGHEWQAKISDRSNGSKCPYCSGKILLKGFNDLSAINPDVAREWSERNLPLTPDAVSAKSRKNVWWKCKECGYEWKAVINSRINGLTCPVCADRKVMLGFNDLATTDSVLLNEWDYEKNGEILPTQISRNSLKKVWWKCSHGHSWKEKIYERTVEERGCAVCEKEYKSVFPQLVVTFYARMQGLKTLLNYDANIGFPLETFIPEEKLAIESFSETEDIENIKQHICDRRGIKLIKLPYMLKDSEIAYAIKIKQVFRKFHIFISSNTDDDIRFIRRSFFEWRG